MKRNIVWLFMLIFSACVSTTPIHLPTENEAFDQLSELVRGDVAPPPGGGSVVSLQALVEVTRACQPIWPDLINVYNTPDDTTTASWAAVALACSNIWPSLIEVLHSTGFGWLTTPVQAGGLLHGYDLSYIGAFLLPNISELKYCDLGGGVKAYRKIGDPNGPDDGFPGSLFGTGHAHTTPVFEVEIPIPVNSSIPTDLPVAHLLQPPTDIRSYLDYHYIRALGYLGPTNNTGAHIYIGHGDHFEYNRRAAHGWINPDGFDNPAGSWYVGTAQQVNHINTNDYIFEIPKSWADQHTPNMYLACGRYRRGQQSGGPTIIAYGPYLSGNPPVAQTTLDAVPLLLYGHMDGDPSLHMIDHCKADTWSAAAWLTKGAKSSVIIVGCKGYGECWYEFSPNRGYKAESYKTEIMFYDPDDLAAVAAGNMETWEPQPYERFDITNKMIGDNNRIFTGGVAYDRDNQLLYVTEQRGMPGAKRPVIHVFKI